jgi:hypothetical protein
LFFILKTGRGLTPERVHLRRTLFARKSRFCSQISNSIHQEVAPECAVGENLYEIRAKTAASQLICGILRGVMPGKSYIDERVATG